MFNSFGNYKTSQDSIQKMLINAFEEQARGMTDAEYSIAIRNLPPELKRNSSLNSNTSSKGSASPKDTIKKSAQILSLKKG